MAILQNIKDKASEIAHTALFQIALGNLEWSRGYLWYVELDDVPPPFHRTGVLGLPVTDILYTVSDGEHYYWSSGIDTFSVPLNKNLCTIDLTMYDDEQATLFTFFERWYNSIYNSRLGVLPATEACKNISIYKLTSSRSKLIRYAYNYDMSTHLEHAKNTTDGRNFLVYPKGPLQEQEKIESNPRTYKIELVILDQQDPDYGNPSISEIKKRTQSNSKELTFLEKASSYI